MATRKSTTKKVNNWYLKYAEREMLIDEDEQGLFCQVPSECEENKLYDVRVDESMLVPVATSCTCKACEHTTSCKHMTVVNNFYKRIYKSNVAKAQAKAAQVEVVEAPVERAKAYDKDLCCMIYADNREIVDPEQHERDVAVSNGITVEQLREIAVIAAEHKAEMTDGKHTEMCLPIGPRDTKKDMMKAALTKNSGFSVLRKVG